MPSLSSVPPDTVGGSAGIYRRRSPARPITRRIPDAARPVRLHQPAQGLRNEPAPECSFSRISNRLRCQWRGTTKSGAPPGGSARGPVAAPAACATSAGARRSPRRCLWTRPRWRCPSGQISSCSSTHPSNEHRCGQSRTGPSVLDLRAQLMVCSIRLAPGWRVAGATVDRDAHCIAIRRTTIQSRVTNMFRRATAGSAIFWMAAAKSIQARPAQVRR